MTDDRIKTEWKNNKEKDCFSCIKKDVCWMFIKNKVPNGKYVGCDKHTFN